MSSKRKFWFKAQCRARRLVFAGIIAGSLTTASAQTQKVLTLQEAEVIAVKNNPQILVATYTALAANQATTQIRSAFFPTILANLTTATAGKRSVISAGNLTTSSVSDRLATGLTVSQLITDFGRTANLTQSSQLQTQAQEQSSQATRAQVLLQVNLSYYEALRAQSVLRVAEDTVAARRLITEQITALAQSKLKSELDVSFARVNLSEAELLLLGAQNEAKAAMARLSEALGYGTQQTFELADEPLPPAPPTDPAELAKAAISARPDLASLRFERDAARGFAAAERNLWFPTITALASAGVVPAREEVLNARYSAVGFNVSIPVFNGQLFSARRAAADLRAKAAEATVGELQNRVARDVQVAWLNADTAHRRLTVTAELLEQATRALELAQARYDLSLSSIVELSQAQLNRTSAEIAVASAKYEYQSQNAVLRYQIGSMH